MSFFSNLNQLPFSSLESQIDRLNSRINQFVNYSICSESSSHSRSSVDLPSPLKFDPQSLPEEYPLNRTQKLFSDYCQLNMKLEDIYSQDLRKPAHTKIAKNPEKSSKEVNIKTLYTLSSQINRLISAVESGETDSGKIQFLGVSFNLKILGRDLPDKQKASQITAEIDTPTGKIKALEAENLELRKKLAVPDDMLKKFCSSFEHSLKTQYFNFIFTEEFKKRQNFIEKEVFDCKSWALLQATYRKLKKNYESCEEIKQNLNWHKSELEFLKSEFQGKIESNLIREGELNFRQEELNKVQSEILSKKSELDSAEKKIRSEKASIEREKNKLSQMKSFIKSQLKDQPKPSDFIQRTSFTPRGLDSSKKSFTNSEGETELEEEILRKFSQQTSTEHKKPPICGSRIDQSDSLSFREERLAEREAELEKREKDIQKNWLKNPTAQEFIPMIQGEMIRLKTLQKEYDKKIKLMQDKLNKSENLEFRFKKKSESGVSSEPSFLQSFEGSHVSALDLTNI